MSWMMNLAARVVYAMIFVALFGILAILGSWVSPAFLAAAWAAHAAWDVAIPLWVDTSYMPTWYAAVCVGFDCVVSLYVVSVIRGWVPATGFRVPRETTV